MSYRKGWSIQEDQIFENLVTKYKNKSWSLIANQLHLVYGFQARTGKQCRQRWHNHLNPVICKQRWTQKEEQLMLNLHKSYGNKWTQISRNLPSRTDTNVKNHFYSTIRRNLRRMSKLMGYKNSTMKMKNIKPCTLAWVFSFDEMLFKQEIGQEEIASQLQKQLHNYVLQNNKFIEQHLMEFTNFKPKTKNQISAAKLQIYQQVLKKIVTLNELYDKAKIQNKKMKKLERKLQNFNDSDSGSSYNSSIWINYNKKKQQSERKLRDRTKNCYIQKNNVQVTDNNLFAEVQKKNIPQNDDKKTIKQQEQTQKKIHVYPNLIENFEFNPSIKSDLNYWNDKKCDEEFQIDLKQQHISTMYSPGFFFTATPPMLPIGIHSSNPSPISRMYTSIVNNELDEIVNNTRNQISMNYYALNKEARDYKVQQTNIYKSISPTSAFQFYC